MCCAKTVYGVCSEKNKISEFGGGGGGGSDQSFFPIGSTYNPLQNLMVQWNADSVREVYPAPPGIYFGRKKGRPHSGTIGP